MVSVLVSLGRLSCENRRRSVVDAVEELVVAAEKSVSDGCQNPNCSREGETTSLYTRENGIYRLLDGGTVSVQ